MMDAKWLRAFCASLCVMSLSACISMPEIKIPGFGAKPEPVIDVAPGAYAEIDRHALNAPAQLKHDLRKLAAYLIEPAQSEAEKARAIFRWITNNIAYDADNYFKGQVLQASAEQAAERGIAVCDGYANLFESLAKLAGLKAETLRGKSKGYSYVMKGQPGLIAHAWNAVRIDGRWHLLDAAWGAGYLDGATQRFVPRFQAHYFLTPPAAFIFDHFPTERRWQLLSRPLSEQDFNQLAYLRPGFFAADLQLRSHQQETIVTRDNPLKITMQVPVDNYISARLLDGSQSLPREVIELDRDGDVYTLTVKFPAPGDAYRVRIFAKQGMQSREFNWALDYRVTLQ